jgi:uncharacterized repeat protein (TIGR02543 family)
VLGGGQVTGGGGQINCGGGATSCYATYVTGTAQTLTPVAGVPFGNWDGCSSLSGSTCTVNLDGGDHEVTANFNPVPAPGNSTLTVSAPTDSSGKGGTVEGGEIDCGSGGTDCTWQDLTGSTFTVVATPDSGYSFAGWGGACTGTSPVCSVTMNGDRSLTATFTQSATTYTLTVSVTGNGTVTGGGIACTSAGGSGCTASEPAGSVVTLTATAGSGAGFGAWGGACAGSSTTCSVTMDAAKTVSATFTGGTGSTFPLTVSVTGRGTVTGNGITCGAGGSDCTRNVAAGTSVTLTATPSTGATFEGWGGACSGSARTCTLTMTAARSVSAAFSGETGAGGVQLSVTVSGPGSVTGGGISCGNGRSTCSARETQGASVTLTATPAQGASFAGWGGACSGAAAQCTVRMDGPRSVSAAFRAGPGTPAAGALVLRSRGRPLVTPSRPGFEVTLRFRTNRRGSVRVRAIRAGRVETALAFAVAPGAVTVGPFPLARSGFYAFELRQGGAGLRWSACLGRCGDAAGAGPFTLVRGAASAVHAGAAWSLTLRFHATLPSGADLRVYRGPRLAREVRFPARAGSVAAGPLLLSPGTYTVRLDAVDAYGRVRTLVWYALLPA